MNGDHTDPDSDPLVWKRTGAEEHPNYDPFDPFTLPDEKGEAQPQADKPPSNKEDEANASDEDDDDADADGWVDLLGSGRLRKRVVIKADKTKARKPKTGDLVTLEVSGTLTRLLNLY